MTINDSEGSLPTWRKVGGIVAFIILVVPFFYAIFYPALTHPSPQQALSQVISYLNSPFVIGFVILAIIFGWAILVGGFVRKSKR